MSYPDCPNNTPDKCAFHRGGGISTCMSSPVLYNRKGEAVGGGANHNSRSLSCGVCYKRWTCGYTDLEAAQGKKIEWELQG